ncbi:sensor histidine kinase [bacterium]|nr:MAG: sensor histidine kinase [bacterium]
MSIFDPEYIMPSLALIVIVGSIMLAVLLFLKMAALKQARVEVANLKKALEEMDEQARLVVRTDLELNKIQEELDRKINSLYALQRISQTIGTTLDENQIFKMISADYLEDLGFDKACGFLYAAEAKKFILCLNIGYTEEAIVKIKSFVESNKEFYSYLIKATVKSPDNQPFRDNINHIFGVHDFIVSPVRPNEGNQGFLFVGKESSDSLISEGDEEIITVLANQLGQALENARLFENTWRAHQELEKKVTERTQELTLVLEEVKKINKRKTDFVSSVSHELRTPLTSIKGYASILLAGKLGSLPEDVRLRLEKINRHSDELVQFINDLLDIARIESGRMTMKKEPLDLNKMLEEVADLLSVQIKDKQITFTVNIAKDLPAANADHNQIRRVFINLINNAIKFTPPSGKISVSAQKVNQDIKIDISDTGCGMNEKEQTGLFQEFYRVDNPINQLSKGTGLGLALVKNIVEAHNGKIWITSKVDQGSTFTFTLPVNN